jgi:hypothetical protein
MAKTPPKARVGQRWRVLLPGGRELLRLRAEVHRLRTEPPSQAPVPGGAPVAPDHRDPGGPPPIVGELITIADRLVDLTGHGAPADPARTAAALRWLSRRMAVLLEHSETVAIADTGPVDLARHEIVDSRPAAEGEPAGIIAETVRVGYLWRGELLRPQQVITYRAASDIDPVST